MAEKTKFVYRPPTKESVNKRQNQSGAFDRWIKADFAEYRPGDGDSRVRILPATWENAEHYGYDVWLHSGVGTDNSTYLCPRKMHHGKGECAICDEADTASREGDKEFADELKAYRKVIVYVVDREEEDKGVQVWGMPATIDKGVVACMDDAETGELILVDSPDEGYDVFFKKEGKLRNVKYNGIRLGRKSTPLSDNEKRSAKWLAYITEHPLPEVLNFYDPEYIAKVLAGKSKKKDEDDDATPKTRHGKSAAAEDDDDATPAKKSKKPADDDDDTPPKKSKPAADDDDGDDAPPKKSKKPPADDDDDDATPAKKSKKDDDDGDDDVPRRRSSKPADDDDDDATPPPKKVKKERTVQVGDRATVVKTNAKGEVVRVDDDGSIRVKFKDDTKKTYDLDELEIKFVDADDAPAPSAGKAAAKKELDDDDDATPAKKSKKDDDDGDDDDVDAPPKKSKKPADDDDD